MPKDPVMLLSYVNTMLRDEYPSLEEFAAANNADSGQICEKLKSIGYTYDEKQNRFVNQG
ncbi:MAG: DUF4250 domain-containing protein [Lachnospiraceae bacterium]|nr:DUF4250 domain-containing protein [Lachnospiraceae bacterium]